MKKETPNNTKDPVVNFSVRIQKSKVKKLKFYLLKKDKSAVQWIEETIEELPEEEELRKRHRKTG